AQLLELESSPRPGAVERRHAQAQTLPVDEYVLDALDRRASQVGQAHDWKLESLGRVDAHQLHLLRVRRRHRTVGLGAGRLTLLRGCVLQEAAQLASLAGFELARQAQQLAHVRQAALGVVEPEQVLAIAARFDRALEHARERAARERRALELQAPAETERCRTIGGAERVGGLAGA